MTDSPGRAIARERLATQGLDTQSLDTQSLDTQGLKGRGLKGRGLDAPPFGGAGAVVRWLGAMQAQEYAPAQWSIGQRLPEAREADIDAAIASGTIVRTHVLRPTWHFVAAEDVRWLLALTGPRVQRGMASYDARLGLDAAVFARSEALIAGALAGGRQLTRTELGAALAAGGIEASGQRLAHIVMHAELGAVICSGAPRGRQQTYALLDERVAPQPAIVREEALAELGRRYLRGHGPATARDLAWWGGLTLGDARRALEAIAGECEQGEVEGVTFWWWGAAAPSTPSRASSRAGGGVRLLQAYDEYVVAYTESRGVIDGLGLMERAVPWGVVGFPHLVFVDGQIAGRWRFPAARETTLAVQAARRLGARELASLRGETSRLARFLGRPLTLEVGEAAASG